MIQHFLIFSGVHGHRDSLSWLQQIVDQRRPDALLFAGGILPRRRLSSDGGPPWGMTLAEGQFVKEFFTTLGKLNVFTAVIPGPAADHHEEFFRLALQAEMAFPTVHITHATIVEEGSMAVCGLGGVLAEQEVLGQDSYSRPTAEYLLRCLARSNRPCKVLLLPAPPPGRLGGREGEPLIGDLIDSFHPTLCVVAGPSQCRGSEHIGHTLVVNPGCLADGSAAWLSWGHGEKKKVEFLDLGTEAARKPPSQQDIQRRAYLLWEADGKRERDPLRFWLEAEKEACCS